MKCSKYKEKTGKPIHLCCEHWRLRALEGFFIDKIATILLIHSTVISYFTVLENHSINRFYMTITRIMQRRVTFPVVVITIAEQISSSEQNTIHVIQTCHINSLSSATNKSKITSIIMVSILNRQIVHIEANVKLAVSYFAILFIQFISLTNMHLVNPLNKCCHHRFRR